MPTGIIPPDVIAAARASRARGGIFASVILAQWALESTWGTRMSGKNNPFGIKARAGQPGTAILTHEQNTAGVAHAEVDRFANYEDMTAAFEAHRAFLGTPRYAPVRAAKTPDDAARQLRACGYATDVNYPGKLIAIMTSHNLYQHDVLIERGPVAAVKPIHKGKAASAAVVVVATGAATAAGYHGALEWVWGSLGLAGLGAGLFAFFHFRR